MTYRVRLWKWEMRHCQCDESEIYLNYKPPDPDAVCPKKMTLWNQIMTLIDKLLM